MKNETLTYIVPVFGILALIFAFIKANWVNKQDPGTDRMKEICGYIREGAMAFLYREYKVLAIFVICVAILLAIANLKSTPDAYRSPLIALSFIFGAFCSGLSGFFGMRVATAANARTTNAARTSLTGALKVAFSGGSVMGMCVVGLGILGLGALLILYRNMEMLGDASTPSITTPISSQFSNNCNSSCVGTGVSVGIGGVVGVGVLVAVEVGVRVNVGGTGVEVFS